MYLKMIFSECKKQLNCFCIYEPCRTWWYLMFRMLAYAVKKFCLIKDICRKSGLLSWRGTRKTLLLYQMCALTFSGAHGDSRKHNSTTLLFRMVYKHSFLPLFPEEAEFRIFLNLKNILCIPWPSVTLLLLHFSTSRECRVTADELFSTRTFPKAFVLIWFKENKYSEETCLLTPHFHLGNKLTKDKASSA